jgi:hypothetical protein
MPTKRLTTRQIAQRFADDWLSKQPTDRLRIAVAICKEVIRDRHTTFTEDGVEDLLNDYEKPIRAMIGQINRKLAKLEKTLLTTIELNKFLTARLESRKPKVRRKK